VRLEPRLDDEAPFISASFAMTEDGRGIDAPAIVIQSAIGIDGHAE
jgi:hypothetical protein